MKVVFDQRFLKDVQKVKNESHRKRVLEAIIKLEDAEDLTVVPQVKALKGHSSAYRMRVGDYRIGFFLHEGDYLELVRLIHRKDIYKKFP